MFGTSCLIDERGYNVVAGEISPRDILLQVLQAEIVLRSFEDVKVDEEVASSVWLIKLEVNFRQRLSFTLSSVEKTKTDINVSELNCERGLKKKKHYCGSDAFQVYKLICANASSYAVILHHDHRKE